MAKQDLYKQLQEKLEAVKAALKVATDFADEHSLEFFFNPTDHWRMGGTYHGKGTEKEDWDSSSCEYEESGSEIVERDVGEWVTSSDEC